MICCSPLSPSPSLMDASLRLLLGAKSWILALVRKRCQTFFQECFFLHNKKQRETPVFMALRFLKNVLVQVDECGF